jgi:uncharacterized protein YkwD
MMMLVRATLLLLVASLVACGTRSAGPSPARPSMVVRAPGPSADAYRTEPTEGDALRGPHASRVSRGLARAMQDSSHNLTPDARLGELALWVAGSLDARGSPPPLTVIDLWAHHLGLPEPAPHMVVLSQSDAATLEDRVASEVSKLLPQLRYTHYGAGTIELNGSVIAVIVLSWRWLELSPVARTLQPDAVLELKGRLLDDLTAPQLVVSYPDGTSYRGEAEAGTMIAFGVPTRGRGEHRVELLASSPRGETVVANFPLYVGVAPVTEVMVQREPADGEQLDEPRSKQRLLDLINEDRHRAGLTPLADHDALGRVARLHSYDMELHSFVGHTSPTTGNAEDRLRVAGIRTPVVLENIGRGYSPDEVHRGLMESPGHRENVLNPEVTHVGIGVVLAPEDQRTAYLVTELFARFAAKIDVADAPERWLQAINGKRSRRGLRPLTLDKTMAELCKQTATEFFRTPSKSRQQLVEDLNRNAANTHPPYKRIAALLTVVTALEEGAGLDALLDPRARAVGLGVAQSTRSDTIENAIVLVALIGE